MIYFLTTLLLFGSMEVVSQPLMGRIDPFTLTLWRFVIGLTFLVPYAYFHNELGILKRLTRRQYAMLATLGFLNTFFSMSMLQLAVKHSGAATAALIFCSNPIFVFFIAILLKEEAFVLKRLFGIFVGIVGIILVTFQKGVHINEGAIYATMASLSFALYTVLNKKALAFVPPLALNIGSFIPGIGFALIFALVSGKEILPSPDLFENTYTVIALAFLGWGVSGIGYVTFIKTIKTFSPISASLIFLLKPVVATILAFLFLEERITPLFLTGMLLVLVGSGLVTVERMRRTRL